jgi:hypothetical protein
MCRCRRDSTGNRFTTSWNESGSTFTSSWSGRRHRTCAAALTGRRFAAALNTGTRPFHVINYLGGCGGVLVFHGPRLTRLLDRIVSHLHRRLDAETEESLARHMHFPVDWDPFFADTMTVADVYHYGTQHYDFHRAQLTLEPRPA